MVYPEYRELSILILLSFGGRNCLTNPGYGANVNGFSAVILHSIACPLAFISSCYKDNPLPVAIFSCCSTISTPVTASVMGCST